MRTRDLYQYNSRPASLLTPANNSLVIGFMNSTQDAQGGLCDTKYISIGVPAVPSNTENGNGATLPVLPHSVLNKTLKAFYPVSLH